MAAHQSFTILQKVQALRSLQLQLVSKARGLKDTFARILKENHHVQIDGLSLEFGLTSLVKSTARKQFSTQNMIWYDLFQRFKRFIEALKIVKRSLDGRSHAAAEATNLEEMQLVVVNICQVIKEGVLKGSGVKVKVEEKIFESLEQELQMKTQEYLNYEKENARDGVDSGEDKTSAADLRNYVIFTELGKMATIFALEMSKAVKSQDTA